MSTASSNLINLFEASVPEPGTSHSASSSQRAARARLGGLSRMVPKGEDVFKESEKAEFYYRVVSGVVRTYTVLNDGRRIIDDFHFAGDILGLASGEQHRFSATCVCDTVVTVFRRSDLDRMQNPGGQVQSSLVVSLRRAQDHLVLLGLRTARERVQAFLGMMAQRASRSRIPDLQMPQADVADYLGLSRETVSRVLTQLECDRPIDPGHLRAKLRGVAPTA